MNAGKQFEQEIKASVPDNVFFYRFRDGTGNFAGSKNENVRFQQSNICDCMMYNGKLYLLELKSHLGKSFPYSAVMGKYNKEKRIWSKEKQLNDLEKASRFDGVISGYVFNFRDLNLTYFVPVRHIHYFFYHSESKSFPLKFIQQYGTEIKGHKLKVHYRWDLKEWTEAV